MGTFDFIRQHAADLANLDVSEDGIINLEYQDFDFSHPDITVDETEDGLSFQVEIHPFTLACSVDRSELRAAASYLCGLANLDVKKAVLESLDISFRTEMEEDVEKLKEDLQIAQDNLNDAQAETDGLAQAIRDLKHAWNIP